MATRTVRTEEDRVLALRFIKEQKLPFVMTTTKGNRRSTEQNRLQRLWLNEISEQTGEEPEDVRALCKLQIGVPILRNENTEFKERYDKVVRPMPYTTKLALMREPFDFPVTRLMTTEQNTKYLDQVFHYFTEKGIVLTQPPSNW